MSDPRTDARIAESIAGALLLKQLAAHVRDGLSITAALAASVEGLGHVPTQTRVLDAHRHLAGVDATDAQAVGDALKRSEFPAVLGAAITEGLKAGMLAETLDRMAEIYTKKSDQIVVTEMELGLMEETEGDD